MKEKLHISEEEKRWQELKLSDNFIFQKFMLDSENCKLEERELAIINMLKKLSAEEVIELGYERDLVMKISEEN